MLTKGKHVLKSSLEINLEATVLKYTVKMAFKPVRIAKGADKKQKFKHLSRKIAPAKNRLVTSERK